MKNIFAFVLTLLTLLVLWRCGDDNSSTGPKNSYYLKMKVDGVLKEYDTCWLYGSGQNINILAGKPGDYAGAYVNDTEPIGVGTYLHTMINPEVNLPMAGIGAYRAPGSTDIYISYQAGWPQYEATVTFTTFEQEVATGTFSGQMRQVNGDIILTVAEGEFRAYIKK